MLPFSSITSIVPLFILGFAYVIYFSASILSRNVPETEKAGQDKIIVKAETSSDSFTYIDFRHAANDQSCEAESAFDFSLKDLSCIILHEAPRGKPAPLHRVSQFSPRPPPLS
ncbi:MAG TPA: hypothetical protein VK207_09850 [Bacteroidales bacterium]|jgi:hypothetical protein|nr:hypothetical protein [Bacteroidales bacterium]